MKIYGPAFFVAFGSALLSPAFAQTSKISTEPPLEKSYSLKTSIHKTKPSAHTAKLPVSDTEQKKAAAPTTIPMDFSGMARRPVDLKSETNPSPRPDTGQQSAPSLGSSPNGGFSPGMKIGF